MPLPQRVLIDTSAFYALLSASDDFHHKARQIYEHLLDREQELWTTSYILVETISLAHRRLGFEPLSTLVRALQDFMHVFWIESIVHNKAWERFHQARGVGMSFVDWTTVLVAQHLKAHVFTFDLAFREQGIPTLPR